METLTPISKEPQTGIPYRDRLQIFHIPLEKQTRNIKRNSATVLRLIKLLDLNLLNAKELKKNPDELLNKANVKTVKLLCDALADETHDLMIDSRDVLEAARKAWSAPNTKHKKKHFWEIAELQIILDTTTQALAQTKSLDRYGRILRNTPQSKSLRDLRNQMSKTSKTWIQVATSCSKNGKPPKI